MKLKGNGPAIDRHQLVGICRRAEALGCVVLRRPELRGRARHPLPRPPKVIQDYKSQTWQETPRHYASRHVMTREKALWSMRTSEHPARGRGRRQTNEVPWRRIEGRGGNSDLALTVTRAMEAAAEAPPRIRARRERAPVETSPRRRILLPRVRGQLRRRRGARAADRRAPSGARTGAGPGPRD